MPIILAILGVMLLVIGIRGTHQQFFTLLQGDFTGDRNFFYWIVALFIIGAVGYIEKLKPLSDAFLVLVLLVLFISNQGFFARFMQQLRQGTATP